MDKKVIIPSKVNLRSVRFNNSNAQTEQKSYGSSYRKELLLEGLCCGNCAAKIERETNNIDGIESAIVDFVSTKLILYIENPSKQNVIFEKVEEIVKRIEPDVKVIVLGGKESTAVKDSDAKEENSKAVIIRLAVGAVIFGIAAAFKFSFNLELLLYFISYVLVGGEVVLRAIKNITRGQVFDENFLMSIATIGAFAIGQLPEGVAVMIFYQIGELFQDLAVNRSRKSIAALMDIRPDFANLKIGDNIKKVSPEEVHIGDIIVVKPGEKVPLDGRVIEGNSMIDASALTGESVPKEVEASDTIYGGVINKNGVLEIEVEKEFEDSTVAKILDLVQNASSKKAPTENFITKFSRYYTPAVVFSAAALALLPPLLISGASYSQWVYRALAFLVVSCPCALVVSIPLGFFGGIGGASKNGILIKGGNYLEALNNVEVVVFDKTGTLTKGVFNVTEIRPQNHISKEELLSFAAHAESYSNHPIALSIIKAYGKEIVKSSVKNYEEISGQGIKVTVEGKDVLAGNCKLMNTENIPHEQIAMAGTIVYIAVNKEYAGSIIISDEIKEDSPEAIKALKAIGIKKTVMLTGDNKTVGIRVSDQLGIDEVYTELLPDQKVKQLELLDKKKSPRGKLVFVGDGINDAPVLARADIGIAMVGFNRRFIPRVRELKEHGKASIIIMQKNRFCAPDYIRRFVVEDFIHVVDTLRFLMDTKVKDVKVEYLRKGEMLDNLIIQLTGEGCTAIGMMNRNGGVTEEIIEYMTGQHKFVVNSLVETTHYHNKEVNISKFGDWEPTLYKRGFYQITDHFIDCVQKNRIPDPSIEDSLVTHEICEKIVKYIDSDA